MKIIRHRLAVLRQKQRQQAQQGVGPVNVVEEVKVEGEAGEKTRTRTERREKKKALLIGIQNYDNVQRLRGPHQDVSDMRDLLIARYEYHPDDIVVLMDKDDLPDELQPTKENIMKRMDELVEGARPGDRFFFHFAGHSIQKDTDNPLEEEDGKDEYIVAMDGEIKDNVLRERLVAPLPIGSSLVAVFDSCHSASLLDLEHFRCNRVYVPWLNKGRRRSNSRWNAIVRRRAVPVTPIGLKAPTPLRTKILANISTQSPRSPLRSNALHQSPITAVHQSPLAAVHQSPLAAVQQSPLAAVHQSPLPKTPLHTAFKPSPLNPAVGSSPVTCTCICSCPPSKSNSPRVSLASGSPVASSSSPGASPSSPITSTSTPIISSPRIIFPSRPTDPASPASPSSLHPNPRPCRRPGHHQHPHQPRLSELDLSSRRVFQTRRLSTHTVRWRRTSIDQLLASPVGSVGGGGMEPVAESGRVVEAPFNLGLGEFGMTEVTELFEEVEDAQPASATPLNFDPRKYDFGQLAISTQSMTKAVSLRTEGRDKGKEREKVKPEGSVNPTSPEAKPEGGIKAQTLTIRTDVKSSPVTPKAGSEGAVPGPREVVFPAARAKARGPSLGAAATSLTGGSSGTPAEKERWYDDLTDSPIQRCMSPEALFCSGFCHDHWEVEKRRRGGVVESVDVISLSASKDGQRSWEDESGSSMTQALIALLKDDPNPNLKDLLTNISHDLHKYYLRLHSMSRDYKKQVKEKNAKLAAKGKMDQMVVPQEVEMVNFQDPQMSSSVPLEKDRRWQL